MNYLGGQTCMQGYKVFWRQPETPFMCFLTIESTHIELIVLYNQFILEIDQKYYLSKCALKARWHLSQLSAEDSGGRKL